MVVNKRHEYVPVYPWAATKTNLLHFRHITESAPSRLSRYVTAPYIYIYSIVGGCTYVYMLYVPRIQISVLRATLL